MKITISIPRGANIDDQRKFLRNEITQAKNIKSKSVRKNITAGLTKILNVIEPGNIYHTDGIDLT